MSWSALRSEKLSPLMAHIWKLHQLLRQWLTALFRLTSDQQSTQTGASHRPLYQQSRAGRTRSPRAPSAGVPVVFSNCPQAPHVPLSVPSYHKDTSKNTSWNHSCESICRAKFKIFFMRRKKPMSCALVSRFFFSDIALKSLRTFCQISWHFHQLFFRYSAFPDTSG